MKLGIEIFMSMIKIELMINSLMMNRGLVRVHTGRVQDVSNNHSPTACNAILLTM